ncbi:MAG: hypothetical protein J0H68_01565 [Sphingobacteriia bacterium]|nr:hypothetical protein [Sphingobacteriia bacterium]
MLDKDPEFKYNLPEIYLSEDACKSISNKQNDIKEKQETFIKEFQNFLKSLYEKSNFEKAEEALKNCKAHYKNIEEQVELLGEIINRDLSSYGVETKEIDIKLKAPYKTRKGKEFTEIDRMEFYLNYRKKNPENLKIYSEVEFPIAEKSIFEHLKDQYAKHKNVLVGVGTVIAIGAFYYFKGGKINDDSKAKVIASNNNFFPGNVTNGSFVERTSFSLVNNALTHGRK